jgi:arginine deiminase
LKYEFEEGELTKAEKFSKGKFYSGRHLSKGTISSSSQTQKYYLSEKYKLECLKSMGASDLVDLVLNGPTVVLIPSEINTPVRIKRISMNPLLNLSFTRDQQIVTRNGLILNRMGSPQRFFNNH